MFNSQNWQRARFKENVIIEKTPGRITGESLSFNPIDSDFLVEYQARDTGFLWTCTLSGGGWF